MSWSSLNCDNLKVFSATITGTDSEVIAANGLQPLAIMMSAAWTAGNILLYASVDGTNFQKVTGWSVSPTAGETMPLSAQDFAPAPYYKFVAAASQAQARSLNIIFRQYLS